ncbi:sulfite exporter TauE/SafE family protein [Ekhidna sp.]|uniref:sulfite exporter TauE/SafE family protein n=1 Tax=Ekhidna sp. TaxID=2608089 RepID=UPI003C799F10
MDQYSLDIFSGIILVAVGILAGFLNVAAGGGSLLTLPMMIFMGLPPNVANATNRVAILWQNVFAIRKFRKSGLVNGKYSFYLGLAAVPGAVLGALLAVDIKGELFAKLLSIVMIMVGITILRGKSGLAIKTVQSGSGSTNWLALLSFFLIGIYGGFIHAGVGFIIILVLELLGHQSMASINSIKVMVAFIYTLSVVLVFAIGDVIHWGYGLTLAIGTSVGGYLGSYFSIKKEDKWIKRLLFVTIVGLSIKLWFYH